MNIEQLNQVIVNVENKIESLNNKINDKQKEIDSFEYSCSDDEYDQMLDEVYGDVEICGYTYSSSRALKLLDEIAYDCGKSDYESNYDLDDVEEYQDLKQELEDLESELEELETELEDFENQLDNLESED